MSAHLNFDQFANSGCQNKSVGNQKRERFLKKQQYLMKKGYFRKKQCLQNQGPPPRNKEVTSEHKPIQNKGTVPRVNGATSEHKPLPSAAHNKSSCPNRQVAESASTSSSRSSSLTITLKTPGQPGRSAPFGNPLKYLALDCEMVGTGPKGRISELARCSIVSYDGDVVYDKYVKPPNPVTDLRTRWSGITWSNLSKATPFAEARKEILKLLAGKVVIGHAVHNDFKALSYGHPAQMTRDTARIPLLNRKAGFAEKECASLKRLTKAVFNRDIQTGRKGHSSVEDARATMELYKVVEVEWERTLASRSHNKGSAQS